MPFVAVYDKMSRDVLYTIDSTTPAKDYADMLDDGVDAFEVDRILEGPHKCMGDGADRKAQPFPDADLAKLVASRAQRDFKRQWVKMLERTNHLVLPDIPISDVARADVTARRLLTYRTKTRHRDDPEYGARVLDRIWRGFEEPDTDI